MSEIIKKELPATTIYKQQQEIERLNKELKFHKKNEKILVNCQNDLTEKLEELKTELQEKQNHIEEYLHKLKEENKQLREELNKSNKINELERLLLEEQRKCKYAKDAYRFTAYEYILKRIQELKGSDKDA